MGKITVLLVTLRKTSPKELFFTGRYNNSFSSYTFVIKTKIERGISGTKKSLNNQV